jgi:PTS system N-acetylgalactosamine-specific IID component
MQAEDILMASKDLNLQDMQYYTDLTPAPRLDNSTLNKMVWRSCNLQIVFNYERMQAIGWLWAMLPGLKKIHTNKTDLAMSMSQNLDFINTHPFLVTFVMGLVLSMEQNKMDIQTIRAVRISTAAPLGGIGDALFWFTLIPIIAGMTAGMAIDGNIMGPILYFILAFGIEMVLRYVLMYWSYNLGLDAVKMMTANAKEFTRAASILGVFIVGALTANYGGGTVTGIVFENGDSPVVLQDYLNTILPCLLPLLITLLLYVLLKKGWTPIKCIFLLLVIGLVGTIFGILGTGYTPLIKLFWSVA